MSAFLHGDKAYDSIALTLIRMTNSHDWRVKRLAEDVMGIIIQTRTAPEDIHIFEIPEWIIKKWSEDLQRANVASVEYRYIGKSLSDHEYKCEPHKGRHLSPVELIKLLYSVNYQSCEVNNWDDTQIAKELRAVTLALAEYIVRESPAYVKAETWEL